MMNPITQFYEKYNLRPFQSTWLLYVHILGLIGLLFAIYNTQLLPKVLLITCIFHNLYAIGITGGVHRLWAHKSYQASTPFKIFLMLLNSGKLCTNFRSQSGFNLSLGKRPQTTPQVFGH
jgi:stearoyl-CoA desaturase (Delta-9 desaturase)